MNHVPVQLYYNKNINNLLINNQRVKLLDHLLDTSKTLSNHTPYLPTPWLRNGHLQTIFTSYNNKKHSLIIHYERDILTYDDQGQAALDWYPNKPTSINDKKPIVLILHGLTGNSSEYYVRATVEKLSSRFRIAVLNFRGCGGIELCSPRLYNAGDHRDLKFAINYIKNKCPDTFLFACGFSLGANLLVKYIGEMEDKCPLLGAVSVSNPNDLIDCSRQMKDNWIQSTFYDPVLSSGLVKLYEKHELYLKDHVIRQEWKTVRAFDRDVTCKFSGHKTADEYYRWASSNQHLSTVKIPLLIFNADDDPISPKLSIPYHDADDNPYILLATTEIGGHIGWWEGTLNPKPWFTKVVAEYLINLLDVYEDKISSEFKVE
ncbi:AB-hydrolase YheT [Neoconidiobolus thromboides FSU 785]|nr:AB-hydrolase YheT [Neoconidiobolus thromboides FSU 785]